MPHYTPLIGTIVAALVVAFVMGALSQRLKISPIAGYLLAGVLVGPFTPGFVADVALAQELAELGVILLMFGVGLHFSLKDLLSVRTIALPGAIAQIVVATMLGMGLAYAMGWTALAGLIFGLALSVASTVVLLRALDTGNLIQTERGRIAVGWLIVEDVAMVLALVLLPGIAAAMREADGGGAAIVASFLGTLLKVTGFVVVMLVIGRRAIPRALHWVVHTGSRELFRLAVLAIALGVAFGAAFAFGVSFALGAFFAGMILGETQLSRRAAEETLPLRDAFAVLFFVAVGMLFNPAVVVEQPLPLVATVLIIVVGKSIAAYALVRLFGHGHGTALTVSASLAQIGEFSFILAGLGLELTVLPPAGRDLILAGAIISILLNPFIFGVVSAQVERRTVDQENAAKAAEAVVEVRREELRECHVVLVGYGRVGKLIARGLRKANLGFVVVEEQQDTADEAIADGMTVVRGNAADERVLCEAGAQRAETLLIAIPEGYEAGVIAERAQRLNPTVALVARAHSDDEVEHLTRLGVGQVIMGEREIARQMLALTRRVEPG